MKGNNEKGFTANPDGTNEAIGEARRSKEYVKPEVISFSAEELLDRLGSARACSGDGCTLYTP
ncbi:hypothetical protein HQ563_07930 [bacterium]|nr:hypothetical protein [bacterium]